MIGKLGPASDVDIHDEKLRETFAGVAAMTHLESQPLHGGLVLIRSVRTALKGCRQRLQLQHKPQMLMSPSDSSAHSLWLGKYDDEENACLDREHCKAVVTELSEQSFDMALALYQILITLLKRREQRIEVTSPV